MIGKVLAVGTAVLFVVPAIAVLTAFGVSAQADRCIRTTTDAALAAAPTDGTAWAGDPISGAQPEDPSPTLDPAPVPAPAFGSGCVPGLGTDAASVTVPAGTPVDVATAVHSALTLVGARSGWYQLCDRLACRAYGYLGSGYPSAAAHWQVMVTRGYAHPGDRCPPLGAFVFFNTGRPYGHVSMVVKADPANCDPNVIQVTSNEVFDYATGGHGGVYLLSFARLDRIHLAGHGYLGWAPPVCAGALLPGGIAQPAPSGS